MTQKVIEGRVHATYLEQQVKWHKDQLLLYMQLLLEEQQKVKELESMIKESGEKDGN